MGYRAVRWVLVALIMTTAGSEAMELNNGTMRLRLGTDAEGNACILTGALATGSTFKSTRIGKDSGEDGLWKAVDSETFLAATAEPAIIDGLETARQIYLAREGSLFRLSTRITNTADTPKPVSQFPVWSGSWQMEGDANRLRWWKALSFAPVERPLADGETFELGSRLHSSDTRHSKGVNPYWVVCAQDNVRLYFALEWCGGWYAQIRGTESGFTFDVYLPENETQLVLQPGESIEGPVLNVTCVDEPSERQARASWMRQREALARTLYDAPSPSYPFVYNHWYTTRFDLTPAFIRNQLDHMAPYDFDYFVIDAGWYRGCGQWEPHPDKFEPGEFEGLMADSKERGVPVGIWTCPQFLKADAGDLPPEVDVPGYYEKFIDGHLLDLAGTDFTQTLLDHVAMLRERYAASWWKYDQVFFAEQTRHGVMRNVIAFQDALRAVRAAHPDLHIENCQSGGRMTNEFTALLAQSHWIRDGGSTGPEHARSNLREALGAMDFLPPWACTRWTNNPDRSNPEDDEFTRYYMRCAMAGTWGLVADLSKISPRQRSVIVEEIAHYRRLNALKADYVYDIHYPRASAPLAGVTFYSADGAQAAVLLLRGSAEGDTPMPSALPGLSKARKFGVEDVDTGIVTEVSGKALRNGDTGLTLDAKRQSALLFIKAKQTQPL
ncbi:MAG: hypothetical protein GWP08_09965 [Nitrospiraceae bacterium]|nr:hypothetical protein [Nitrospiraceae bacterium]